MTFTAQKKAGQPGHPWSIAEDGETCLKAGLCYCYKTKREAQAVIDEYVAAHAIERLYAVAVGFDHTITVFTVAATDRAEADAKVREYTIKAFALDPLKPLRTATRQLSDALIG